MYCFEFINTICNDTTLDINCFNKTIANVPYTKFLGFMTDYINQLISILNSERYAIGAVKAMLSRKGLRMSYFLCTFYHIIWHKFCLFGGGAPLLVLKYSECKKNYLRIMINLKQINSCRKLFKIWKFYLSDLSKYFLFYCMWWTTNTYLQRT
jgi:hypothetical protein